MEYIIIIDHNSKDPAIVQNGVDFIDKFSDYDLAKDQAEQWKKTGCCKEYGIYALCSDDRNHVV